MGRRVWDFFGLLTCTPGVPCLVWVHRRGVERSEADGALLLAFDVCPDDKYVHYVLDESPDGYKFSIQFVDKYNWEKEE